MKFPSWHLEVRNISELRAHLRNPRYLSKKAAKQLELSVSKFGLIDKPVLGPHNQIIGGHQRIAVLHGLGETQVECWVPDDEMSLSDLDIDELNIRLNKNTGDWDWEVLANEWDINDLIKWGFEEKDFDDAETKKKMPKVELEISDENLYDEIVQLVYGIHLAYETSTKMKIKNEKAKV